MTAARASRHPTISGAFTAPVHTSVLLEEVLTALAPRNGGVYVDGTLGGGGYTRRLLEAADCTVWGIDRDPDAIAQNADLAARYSGRLHLVAGRFGDMDTLLREKGVEGVDGVTLDLGVSSPQIDTPERGFSFSSDGPLDMRMERAGESAADVVRTADEADLARILRQLGEERHARRIARAIVVAREDHKITTTGQLAQIVRTAIPKLRNPQIDPATRTFQALRIHVNDELNELNRGLVAAEKILRPKGRFAVVAFHSLEDRRVKSFLRTRSGMDGRGSRHLPDHPAQQAPTLRLVSRRAIRPSDAEIKANARSRSARMRVAERTAEPSWATVGSVAEGR